MIDQVENNLPVDCLEVKIGEAGEIESATIEVILNFIEKEPNEVA